MIQLRGRVDISKGFLYLQTEQLSLTGTQLLQIGHVKPVRMGKRASQKKCVAFDTNQGLERLGYGVTLRDTPALTGVCDIERAEVSVVLLPPAIYYLIAPSHRLEGRDTDPSL